MISILIVDDDLSKISSIITSIHLYYKNNVEIKQASNVQEAIEVLQNNNNFHLLISDLLMPIRINEEADERGGEVLIKEIYKRRNKVNVPIYIVGLTQYDKIKYNFSGVWKVWKYDSSNADWQIKLRDLVFHISMIDSKIVREKKETIFVEGITDKGAITTACTIFYEEMVSKISVEAIKYGGGASWVERQIIIWSKTLFWKDDSQKKYLKALGLFDNDLSGKKALQSIRNQIKSDSAESKTFSIIKLDRKYAKHLIPIYLKGIQIPITLEEMYSPFCWEYAKSQNWLVKRTLSIDNLVDPEQFVLSKLSISEYFISVDLSEQERLFVNYKVNDDHKSSLLEYIKQLPIEDQKKSLYSFEYLIGDILVKLKLK